jgi:hypothetical protein
LQCSSCQISLKEQEAPYDRLQKKVSTPHLFFKTRLVAHSPDRDLGGLFPGPHSLEIENSIHKASVFYLEKHPEKPSNLNH